MRERLTSPGELEQLVLLAILQLGDEAYSVPVLTLLRERARRRVARGALYTVLERLESKGCLRSHYGEPLPERGGRPRRYYTVTSAGLGALRASHRAHVALARGLESLLEGS